MIHGYWLRTLGIEGAYERFAVPPAEFRRFRRLDRPRPLRRRQRHRAAQGGGLRRLRPARRPTPKPPARSTPCGARRRRPVRRQHRRRGVPGQSRRRALPIGAATPRPPSSWAPAARRARSSTLCSRAASSASRSSIARARAPRPSPRDSAAGRPRRLGASCRKWLAKADLLVNTTTLGMAGQRGAPRSISSR